MRSQQPWSVPIRVEDVPETGRHVRLIADEAVRVAVSATAGVNGLARLEAEFELFRQGRDRLRVVGGIAASVRQICVVTLEPITNEVAEAVDVVFVSEIESAPGPRPAECGDATEHIVDGMVDLGALATEFLILGIDPYPRKPGAVFELPHTQDPGNRPFAALSALKKRGAEPGR